MKTKNTRRCLVLWILLIPSLSFCQIEFDHQEDIVYGYKDGMALVMDIFSPKIETNSAGIILVMSGGLRSSPVWSHSAGNRADVQNLLKAGYVVFATAHSSQPKYTIDESRKDIPRAVKFIRHNAIQFGIDPNRIGIMGYSSGGHVSLITAISPPKSNQKSKDPVEKESSVVQAVVAYYPSSDLLNFGQKNMPILEHFHSVGFNIDAAFDFHEWNEESNRFERVEKPETIKEYYKRNSSIHFVSNDDPPILIIHGDEDKLVPIQQSKIIIDKLKEQRVPCKLLIMKGEGHGWGTPIENEYNEVTQWFSQFLLRSEKRTE